MSASFGSGRSEKQKGGSEPQLRALPTLVCPAQSHPLTASARRSVLATLRQQVPVERGSAQLVIYPSAGGRSVRIETQIFHAENRRPLRQSFEIPNSQLVGNGRDDFPWLSRLPAKKFRSIVMAPIDPLPYHIFREFPDRPSAVLSRSKDLRLRRVGRLLDHFAGQRIKNFRHGELLLFEACDRLLEDGGTLCCASSKCERAVGAIARDMFGLKRLYYGPSGMELFEELAKRQGYAFQIIALPQDLSARGPNFESHISLNIFAYINGRTPTQFAKFLNDHFDSTTHRKAAVQSLFVARLSPEFQVAAQRFLRGVKFFGPCSVDRVIDSLTSFCSAIEILLREGAVTLDGMLEPVWAARPGQMRKRNELLEMLRVAPLHNFDFLRFQKPLPKTGQRPALQLLAPNSPDRPVDEKSDGIIRMPGLRYRTSDMATEAERRSPRKAKILPFPASS